MNLLQLLTLLLPNKTPTTNNVKKEVLRDYPGCGQLGDPSKKECFWGCDWVQSPIAGKSVNEAFGLIGDKLEELGMKQNLFIFMFFTFSIMEYLLIQNHSWDRLFKQLVSRLYQDKPNVWKSFC